jgi:L-glutamine-phosphate cytidylyltransferase
VENNNNIKAIILAAGEGTRLRPYTLDRPKCLVEVDGTSLLDRQLAVLASENVRPVIMIGGYRAEMLDRPNITLRLNPRFHETNMVWTLFCAESDMEGDVLICYGDIVYSRQVLQAILASKADIATTIDLDWEAYWRARSENPLDDAETLKMGTDGTIYEIGNKPDSLADVEGQYMGLIKLSAKGVKTFKRAFQDAKSAGNLQSKPVEKAYMTDLLQAVINAGNDVNAVLVNGGWVEVDTVDDLHNEITKERLSLINQSLRMV